LEESFYWCSFPITFHQARLLRRLVKHDPEAHMAENTCTKPLVIKITDAIISLSQAEPERTYALGLSEGELWYLDGLLEETLEDPYREGQNHQELAMLVWSALHGMSRGALLQAPDLPGWEVANSDDAAPRIDWSYDAAKLAAEAREIGVPVSLPDGAITITTAQHEAGAPQRALREAQMARLAATLNLVGQKTLKFKETSGNTPEDPAVA
jgi:hypothetical protein